MADLLVRDVRLDGVPTPVDIVMRDGRIDEIAAASAEWDAWVGPVVAGGGHLALPGLVDGHAHLDKTMWGQPWRPHSAAPGLAGLIANEREGRRTLPPVAERAAGLLEAYSAHGATLIRSHVDVDVDAGLSSIEGVLDAARQCADRIEVQVVAFPQSGMLVAPGTVDLLDAAIRAGADVVGGIDPGGFDGDAVAHLDAVFAIADRHGCGVDVHLHDRGSLGRHEVSLIIERTRALGLQGKVMLSHAFCLCDGDPAVAPIVEQLGELDIGVSTVAPGNVEPLPLDLLETHGVAVCLGQDGIRDLWSPWGDADMLARAGLMAWRAGARRDADIARCVDIATTGGARAIGVTDRVLEAGGRGDLVLLDVATAAEAAVVHPPRSLVVHRAQVVHTSHTSPVVPAGPSSQHPQP
ncbi:MAG: amidohydrolase [Ilumatobacteraceae bacterium]